jgi:hypothetical protein
MRSGGLLIGVVLALCAGYFIWQRSVSGPGQGPPQQQIDVIAIRQRLLAAGQAERQYQVTHGTYATLDQLTQEGMMAGGTELRGYRLTGIATGGDGFTITATPIDANKPGWPTLEINESMEITQR